MVIRFTTRLVAFPNGERPAIVPVCEAEGDEALAQFLHSDANFFRGDGMQLFDRIIAGRMDGEELTCNRSSLAIQVHATIITDLYADPELGIGFPMLVIGTRELRENIVAWHAAEDAYSQQ